MASPAPANGAVRAGSVVVPASSSGATATLALLADGRFPTGGHAHSGGFEAASAVFGLDQLDGLRRHAEGRLTTVGRTEAALVAAVLHRLAAVAPAEPIDWAEVDSEIDARIVSPTLRAVSRSLGRQWVRAGRRIWPSPALDAAAAASPDGPHQVAAYAAVAHASGVDIAGAVTVHLHHLVAGVATAAIRLHGIDPFEVQLVQVSLLDLVARLVDEAIAGAARAWSWLPATTGPVADVLAEEHARWDMRLFQS